MKSYAAFGSRMGNEIMVSMIPTSRGKLMAGLLPVRAVSRPSVVDDRRRTGDRECRGPRWTGSATAGRRTRGMRKAAPLRAASPIPFRPSRPDASPSFDRAGDCQYGGADRLPTGVYGPFRLGPLAPGRTGPPGLCAPDVP